MSLNTYPANPFPPSTNQMDADALETEVSQIKSGLTNYENQNNINLEVPDRKNILPMTVEGIKAANTDGTWSGNTYTQNGISYTININNDGNIASIDISGTNTDNSQFNLTNRYIPNKYKDMILNGYNGGSKEEGEQNELYVAYSNNGTNWASDINCYDGDAALTKDYPYIFVMLVIRAQTNFSKTVYPMIRPATITDPTFAPYIPSVESRIEAVESGLTNKVDVRKYDFADSLSTYSIPSARASAYMMHVNIPLGANRTQYGFYLITRQGTELAKTDISTDALALTVTLSGNDIVLAWTATNTYGGNITLIPLFEIH